MDDFEDLPKPEISLAGHVAHPRGLYTMAHALRRWLIGRGIEQDSLKEQINAGYSEVRARKRKQARRLQQGEKLYYGDEETNENEN